MTRATNARIAGVALLLYIAIGITQMAVFGGTTAGDGTAARLATMARHVADVRVNVLLTLLTSVVALALGVALYALTRDEDPDIAMLALVCRVAEGVVGVVFIPVTLGLLALATTPGVDAPPPPAVNAVGLFVLAARPWNPVVAAFLFAVGSTLFSWLLLRGRMIPVPLAWLGVAASVLLVVALPLQLAGTLPRQAATLIWMPMLAFEVPLAAWLLAKGAGPTTPGR